MKNIWTPAAIAKFTDLYPILPMADLLEHFPLTTASGLKSAASRYKLNKKGRLYSWRYEDELKLAEIYSDLTNLEIGQLLGKSESVVSGAAFKLRLFKSEEFHRIHREKGLFKPGLVPATKGRKQSEYMSPEAIERTKATRFKKGGIPPNAYNEVGKITIRHDHPKRGGKPYQYICIALGNWVPLHRHVWEQAYGPIPPKHIVRFKDGDTMNCELGNLELITMKQNRLMNAGHHTLTDSYVAGLIVGGHRKEDKDIELKEALMQRPDLLELKRNQVKLQRAIKSHDKNANGE